MKKNKRLIGIISVIALLLSVPLIAMQFTNEVNWTLSDFVVMGALMSGVGFLYELTARCTGNLAYRSGVALALVTSFLLVWINLAVGIIGGEDNPLNMLYFGVILVGLAGAVFSQFKATGMSRAFFFTAAIQLCIPGIAFLIGRPTIDSPEWLWNMFGVFLLSAFFALMYAASGVLFMRAQSS